MAVPFGLWAPFMHIYAKMRYKCLSKAYILCTFCTKSTIKKCLKTRTTFIVIHKYHIYRNILYGKYGPCFLNTLNSYFKYEKCLKHTSLCVIYSIF